MNSGSRAPLRRSGTSTRMAAALLLLVALGPFASALAAPAGAGHCCAGAAGALATPPAPCQWIAATSCCDSASAVGSAPQPTPPPAVLLLVATLDSPEKRSASSLSELDPLRPDRWALSTIVLLL